MPAVALERLAAHVLGDGRLTVVDVGALWGLLPELEPLMPWIDAVGFDPDEAECAALEARARAEGWSQRFLPYAIAGSDGTRPFHVCRKAASSSLLEPDASFHARFPEAERLDVVRTVDVETRALGPLLDELDVRPEFLKLDVHGVEGEILSSLTSAQWEALLGVHVELLLGSQYVGQTPIGEIHSALVAHGLELYDLKRYGARRDGFDTFHLWTRGQVTTADALYLRRGDALGRERRRRLGVLAALFGHHDAASAELDAADDGEGVALVRAAAARRGPAARRFATSLIRLGALGQRIYGPPAGSWASDQPPDGI